MKKVHLLIVVVSVLLMWSCTTMQFPQEQGEAEGGTSDSAEVFVYSFEETEQLQPSDMRDLVNNYLNTQVSDEPFVSEENIAYYVSSEDVNSSLELDLDTGNFSFYRMGRYMGNFEPDLPSPNESRQLALEYLRDNELYPENESQLQLVHQGGLRSATITANNQRENVIDKTVTLTYGRTIDDLPVIGPGSKIVVQVGDDGEIVGLIDHWREIANQKAVSKSQLISEREAQRQANQQINEQYGEVDFKITNVFKAYYDNNESTLQPVYGFETLIQPGDNLETLRYLCVIPMMKNPPEDLNLTEMSPQAREMIQRMREGGETGESEGEIE